MIPRRRIVVTLAAVMIAWTVCPASAQDQSNPGDELEKRIRMRNQPQQDWRTRLNQVDQLVRLGSLGRATTMLEQLEKTGAPRNLTLPVWVHLAEARGEHEETVALCREGLSQRPGAPRLLRSYARALMSLGRFAQARTAVADLIAGSKNKITVLTQSVVLWQEAGHPGEGLALCDSLREAFDDPQLLRRPRAVCLLALDRVDEAMDEFIDELANNPMNVALVRDEILGALTGDVAGQRAVGELDGEVPEAAATPVALLKADLLLRLGRGDEAVAAVEPLYRDRTRRDALLRTATSLLREAPLIDDPVRKAGTYRWLLSVMETMASTSQEPGQSVSIRVYDLLAQASLDALEAGILGGDGGEDLERVESALDLLRRKSPGATRLYAAQVLLARHTRDVQRRPREAAARLELLLSDLDLPLQGLALCRLELGLCYFADADTLRARRVLTRLGRDGQYPEAAGPAHFLLAQLDLAQGHWESSRDRLAAVALDNPKADHANDALDLALLLTNELEGLESSPALFDAFGESILWRLLDRPDLRRAALEDMLTAASAQPGLVRTSGLVSRGRLDLAAILAAEGEPLSAAVLCGAVVHDRPDGPYAAQALERQGTWYLAAGNGLEARRSWERLLAQYPDAIHAEDARLRLRELP